MRLIVTRPLSEAQAWVQDLQAAGHQALALPLIDIAALPDQTDIRAAKRQWATWQAVMFVSAQAVRMFFALHDADSLALDQTVCWATGPGTRKALLHAGVPASCVMSPPASATQFDSEALWQVVQDSLSDAPVLIVRGRDQADESIRGAGRDWLAQQLQARGVEVRCLVAYARCVPQWTSAQQQLARDAAQDGSVWLLTSSQAVKHLSMLLAHQDWSQAVCWATHERIAQAATALGFGRCQVIRPMLSDLLSHLA